ncbi:MAG: aminotransferase class V-fold PLP-dependent enzyme [Gammaproteobacteria bacterium]|nr:aminotransferase class V-fold PLP-dependent enzyme [Gammaproteobacteria bacterium]
MQNQFPVNNTLIYLNHAAVAPLPAISGQAIQGFVQEYVSRGASRYPSWLETEHSLRSRLASLIRCRDNDIALLKNTSEALSVVAHGFPWQPGDVVVISDEEFPSNRIAWESLKDRGVTVREVSLGSAESAEQALLSALDSSVRMLAISSVEYASGIRLDLARLGQACRDQGIAFCVDAIQGLGVFDHDVDAMHIDFLMADGHKWLLGPEGLAVFYCKPEWRDRLTLHQFGWHMIEHHGDYNRKDWQPARSARRFECGSPNMLGIYGLNASLALILETGIKTIEQEVTRRSRHIMHRLNNSGLVELNTPTKEGEYAGIVNFRHRGVTNDVLFRHLGNNKVVCAQRGKGIRFSPHFHTPMERVDQAIDLVINCKIT